MSEYTAEQWEQMAENLDAISPENSEASAMMRSQVALLREREKALEARRPGQHGEPVAEVYEVPEDWGRFPAHLSIRATAPLPPAGSKLYAAPPAATVPDGLTMEMLVAGADAMEKYVDYQGPNDDERYNCIASIWNAMHNVTSQPDTKDSADG